MSILDLNPGIQGVAMGPQPGEAARLPVTFGEGFDAAWHENQLFGQSVARTNARAQALDAYLNEVREQTGKDISGPVGEAAPAGEGMMWMAAQQEAKKLGLTPPTDDEITERAVTLSRQARSQYADVAAREKAGGGAGIFFGGLAGSATDPLNLVAAPVGGGEGGILLTALKFGAAAAATQTGNEALQAGYREQVQPGYAASGEPLGNVLMAGAQGAVIGGGTKALGNLWTRVKTGAWPTSVRDAGNILESEANVQQSNIYPGAAGEAAHRDALATSIDQVTKGEPVDVAAHITPEIAATADERFAPLMEARAAAQRSTLAAEAARPSGPAPELPFEQTAAAREAENATSALAGQVTDIAKRAGYDMPPEEAAQVAARMVKAPDEEVGRALDTLATSPSRAAEVPGRVPRETPQEPVAAIPPAEVARIVASPEHEAAVRADIDRARMTKDVKIPAGVDEKGEPVFRSLDSAMDEVDGYKAAADQIQACAAPAPAEPVNG